MKRLLLAVAALALGVAAVQVGPGDYMPKGGNMVGGDSLTVPDAVFGGFVTATYETEQEGRLWIYVEASQAGEVVFAQYVEVAGGSGQLGPFGPTPSWAGGAADGYAELQLLRKHGNFQRRASVEFAISG